MITTQTADALEALAAKIWNPADGTGLHGQDSSIDAQLASLITEPIKAIDGRDLAVGFKYTLNVTNALQLRAKHWYMDLSELMSSSLWPAVCKFTLSFSPGPGVMPGPSSFGYTIGLATCAAICRTWAFIIRKWLTGNYVFAVNQPDGLIPIGYNVAPAVEGGLAIRSGFEHNPGPIWKIISFSPPANPSAISVQFYSDPTNQFPVNDQYEVNLIRYFNMEDLIGIAPV